MTRKSSKASKVADAGAGAKAPKEKRSKEPEVERFRTIEELNDEFDKRRIAGFKSISELTKNFKQQPGPEAKEPKKLPVREDAKNGIDKTSGSQGTGVLKKIFEGRGFGFVAPDQDNGAGDIFLHFSDIANGGARSLGVGTRVRYNVEPDVASGRLRAKNVSIISETGSVATPDITASQVQKSTEGTSCSTSTSRAYSRDIMLGVLRALAGSSRLKKVNRLKFSTVPMPPETRSERGVDQENPYLDDERLIARLEARLDLEIGADDMNMQTFGTCSGWSFEDALAANAKLRKDSDEILAAPGAEEKLRTVSEDSKQSGASTAAPLSELADTSELEDESEVSAGRRKGRKESTWSWEEASEEGKHWYGHRQSWEPKQKQVVCTAAPQFQ